MKRIILLLCCLLCISCASANSLQREGFRNFIDAFNVEYVEDVNLHDIFYIEKLEVHVVGSQKNMDWARAYYNPRILGYFTVKDGVYQIWVYGVKTSNGIIVNQAILGHELNHVLSYINKGYKNPDEED